MAIQAAVVQLRERESKIVGRIEERLFRSEKGGVGEKVSSDCYAEQKSCFVLISFLSFMSKNQTVSRKGLGCISESFLRMVLTSRKA